MSREGSTYRASRRNFCRAQHMMWSDRWYFAGHSATYRSETMVGRLPSKYHPLAYMREFLAKAKAEKVANRIAAKASLAAFGATPLERLNMPRRIR
jgi:hypothetical protein